MKDFMGSRTTYYSLANDRLKGKHPRIYNLILILTLMSLTGTAAFLISDIFSFGIDYDDMSIQGGKGIIFPALWGDKKASSGAADDGGQENALSALDANASPNKAMSSQSTSNSTGKDENGNASMELDSSKTSSATGAATGSIASAKKTRTSTSSKKSHSSSGSSSSSRSKSSSEKAEEKAAVPDNESANVTATNQTTITQLPENRSDTLSTQKDNATAKEQSNKPAAGVYRNESSQSLIDHDGGDDPASGSKSLNSETAAAGTADGMETLADDGGQEKGYPLSALGANASPNGTISSQSTSNSTGKDENGNASMELDLSQTSSATGQATGSIASAKKTVTSTSSNESHSSSGSSSSSRSKSSSEKAEEKAAVPNNESANTTATNQTTITQLPENRSDTLSTQKDNATAKEQSNKPTAGVYRNESPQSLIDHDGGGDPATGSKSLNSETAVAGTTDGMEILADDEGSAKANERQESRSVKRDELAKDRAERNEKVANERAVSSKRGQRQSRIAGT